MNSIISTCVRQFGLAVLLVVPAGVQAKDAPTPPKRLDRSHSHINDAFNTGPRQLAKLMHGLGNANLPVTTKSPEAQRYFNQGMNMAYTFWWYEAERAFRQVVKLDPDCAMGYWGLAFAVSGGQFFGSDRAGEFIKLAEAKAPLASDREQRYIKAFGGFTKWSLGNGLTSYQNFRKEMEALLERYPDDIEAKVLYGSHLEDYMESDIARRTEQWNLADRVYRQVMIIDPIHTGVHHHRIHLWDNRMEYAMALENCDPLAQNAPNVGHAHHMSGHIYSGMGLWNKAAERMDAGTRAERQYMYTQGRMPFHSWNYFHNQEYLVFALGFAGRIREGLQQRAELDLVPKEAEDYPYDWGVNGYFGLLIKSENWDFLLSIEALQSIPSKTLRLYGQGMAYLAKDDIAKAERTQRELAAWVEKQNDADSVGGDLHARTEGPSYQKELGALLKAQHGDIEGALTDLREVDKEIDIMLNDPCPYAHDVAESIGRILIDHKRYRDAEEELRKAKWKHNGYVDALLIEAQLADGRIADAEQTYAAMQPAWLHADADLPALARVQRMLDVASPGRQRWKPAPPVDTALERFGPATWQPYPAPDFTVTAPDGKPIKLRDYKGRNLVLVFYLGGKCVHCMEQLRHLAKEQATFAAFDTDVLAVSSDSVAANRQFMVDNPEYPLRLASDKALRAAKALAAYDEFEDLELHATLLIDRQGRVWWYTAGSTPFMKFEHLKQELMRMNAHQAGM